MALPRPGNIQSAHVLEFCDSVVPAQLPILVPHEPLANKPLLECLTIVPEHVAHHGGKQLTGWAIWEGPHIIEAEFHAVWRNPEGRIVDLTPRPSELALANILFLEDTGREYTGRQIDNIRKPLVDSFNVKRLIKLLSRRFEILNEGDLADQYEIQLAPAVEREYRELEKEVMKLQLRLSKF
ncbi:zinc chelation protein SecC [Pseudomonas sp. RIT357]|uniref:zinc chelation protein SecC n=1 Tax=Pseudomonas sp. RIT357 TaxID=1470593 RepID=UPI00044DCDCE|nr:zinc chelation protein SecC [Pseudomonas sp. RIT357]EZP65463.1 hypothetical protein BW43_03063 [Pseudomonas sp. RIT357]